MAEESETSKPFVSPYLRQRVRELKDALKEREVPDSEPITTNSNSVTLPQSLTLLVGGSVGRSIEGTADRNAPTGTKMEQSSVSRHFNCRILVVEDEPVLAMLLQDALAHMGCNVVLADEINEAVRLAATELLDCAFLDVKIRNDTVVAVADVLVDRHIPFVFSSNYGKELLPERYQSHALLPKPYFPDDIAYIFRTQLNIKLAADSVSA